VVGQEARILGSILWQGVTVERGAALKGCIIGDGARVGEGSSVGEGCILGDKAILGKDNHIDRGTVLWPDKLLEPETISFQ
jgi:NDP-sugar pyrophosphorylase family protein